MILANSWVFLWGLGLIAIPIVLHFLLQPKPKLASFPALRFLREQHLASRRKMQIRHWILLALRGLVILLLALALAGPAVAEADFGRWLGVSGFAILAVLAGGLAGLNGWQNKSAATALSRDKGNIARRAGEAKTGPISHWFTHSVWLLPLVLGGIATLCGGVASYLGYQLYREGSGAVIGNSQEPISAVIVIDNSLRMAYQRENQTNFARAQEMGEWVLSQLPPDSQVAVVDLADDQPFFSVDFAAARKRLQTLDIRYLSIPVPEAVRRAWEFLRTATHPRREVYVISDLTKPTWTSNLELARLWEKDPDFRVFVIDVGALQPVNLALTDIELNTDQLSSVSRLVVTARIASSGVAEERRVELAIEKPNTRLPVVQDGRTVVPQETWSQSDTIAIPATGGAELEMAFGQTLPVGVHHGSIAIIGGDGLAIDDRRYFTVEVRERWRALLVAPTGVDTSRIALMLAPESLSKVNAAPFECQVITPKELTAQDLGGFQSVYLLDPGRLEESDWGALRKYVTQGGGLGIFLGNNARLKGSAVDPSFLTDSARALLGGELTNVLERLPNPASSDSLWYLSPRDLSHPLFKLIRSYESSLAWYSFPVYRHWGMVLDETPEFPTQVILEYNNREPAIVERTLGAGRILIMTTPLTETQQLPRAWNQLFAGQPVPTFLLLRQLTEYLAQIQRDTLNLSTGNSAILKNDLRQRPEVYALFTPDLQQTPTRVTSDRDQIRYKFTDRPGQYRLKGSKDDRPVLRGFSANLPPAATDLSRVEVSDLDRLFGEGRYQLARDRWSIERQQGKARQGQEFYPLIIAFLCVVFGLEYLMSNRFYAANRSTVGGDWQGTPQRDWISNSKGNSA